MAGIPAGTVTFLFTDIEGSTQLLKRLGGGYAGVLDAQGRIVRDACLENEGKEIDTQGDSFFFAFGRAREAVAAAVTIQRRLVGHEWPEEGTVRLRIGIHTGEPLASGERYVGMSVHRAARISALGHGGQVLLSNTTRELVEDDLPTGGLALRELGFFRLKDIDRPERIFQLEITGLQSDFPTLAAEKSAFGAVAQLRSRPVVLLTVTVLVVVVVLTVGALLALRDGSTPRGTGIVGSWAGVDSDGSEQTFVVAPNSDGGTYELTLRDDQATVCGGGAVTGSGVGTLAGKVLAFPRLRLECATGSDLEFSFELTYDADTDKIVDQEGVVWSRVAGDVAEE